MFYKYFFEILLAWKADFDMQPVFNHQKVITYMSAYFSKSEDETKEAMKRAVKAVINGKNQILRE